MEHPGNSDTNAGLFLPQEEAIRSHPSLHLKDKRTWWFYKNGEDQELQEAVALAERLARTMQQLIDEDESLEAAWAKASTANCDEFSSDHIVSRAVTILARTWYLGTDLRELVALIASDTKFTEESEPFS